MPKLGMAPIRRKQLVEAAIAVIHEQGFANATVARIARQAGISAGMVHHYFKDKDDLLFATMRHLLAELRADAVARLSRAADPRQRIRAIIDACFGERAVRRAGVQRLAGALWQCPPFAAAEEHPLALSPPPAEQPAP